MILYQGYKSNVIAEVEDIDEAAEVVQERHPGWKVYKGIDGDVVTAVLPGNGGKVYGLQWGGASRDYSGLRAMTGGRVQ